MTQHQRSELIRILRVFHDLEELSKLTDPQLHELWLVECEYENPYKDK